MGTSPDISSFISERAFFWEGVRRKGRLFSRTSSSPDPSEMGAAWLPRDFSFIFKSAPWLTSASSILKVFSAFLTSAMVFGLWRALKASFLLKSP